MPDVVLLKVSLSEGLMEDKEVLTDTDGAVPVNKKHILTITFSFLLYDGKKWLFISLIIVLT